MTQIRTAHGIGFEVPDGAYLLSHSVGCMPVAARAALEQGFLQPWSEHGSSGWEAWIDGIHAFRVSLQALLGGALEGWCPQPGVSAATSRLISALPASGRHTLLVSRQAFPSVGFAMTGLDRLGYHVHFVDGDPGDIGVWRAAMTDDVAVALFTHVHSNSGQVSPLRALGDEARRRGIFSIADICQSAGIVELDVVEAGCDAVVGSCVKWLCGGPGAGFLWLDPRHFDVMRPPERGWFSHAEPFAFVIDDFRYAPDALRFWGGTPSVAPYIVARAGIEAIRAIGVSRILAHNRMLFDLARQHLPDAWADRINLVGRGGTLCLDAGMQAETMTQALTHAGCMVDQRGTVIRLSMHVFNTREDTFCLAEALGSLKPVE